MGRTVAPHGVTRVNHDLTLPERIDALSDAWVTAYPDLTANLFAEDTPLLLRKADPRRCPHIRPGAWC